MKLTINLASRRHLNQKMLNMTYSLFIFLLLLVLLIQGKTFFDDYRLAKTYYSHLDALQVDLQGKLPERADPKEQAEQRQTYNQAKELLQRDSFRWTELFDRMERVLPDGVSLKSFNPDYEKNSLAINGTARSLKNLQILLDRIHAESFQRVYLQRQGEVLVDDGRGGKITALSFSIRLSGVF